MFPARHLSSPEGRYDTLYLATMQPSVKDELVPVPRRQRHPGIGFVDTLCASGSIRMKLAAHQLVASDVP